jgi:cytosine/adenosine deaminase-related metal-dependent hydrolase
MTPRAIHADCIHPGDGAPLRDAVVVVDGRGTVLDVGPAAEVLPRHAGCAVVRARGLVVPGFVNAHTHLELSALRGRVTGGLGFVTWVESLIGARAELDQEEEAEAVTRAVRDLDAFGTAAVGEVTNSLAAVHELARAGIAGCVFHEVFGVALEQVRRRAEGLEAELAERVGRWPTSDLAYAPAPHTLYTTHLDVVALLVSEARAKGRCTSLHLLEHAGERRAIEEGDGPVVDWLEVRARTPRAAMRWPRAPVIDVAERVGALAPDVLLVHLTEARPAELARIASSGAPVVLCPRSNLFIGVRLPPLLAVLEAGIEPALGTDSLASNASLDVLAEARALADRFPTVPCARLLAMATWNGARALGRTDLGRIVKGARPGLLHITLDALTPSAPDPCRTAIASKDARREWLVRREP